MKNTNRLMNPIGIIALFSGLSEASAATVLPYLDEDTRQLYTWFLIAFPSVLVLLFFLTLNLNPRAFYLATDLNNKNIPPINTGPTEILTLRISLVTPLEARSHEISRP